MDIATIVGLIVAFGGVIVGFIMEGGKPLSLIEPSAMVIVFGGTLGATITSFSLKHITSLPNIARQAFFAHNADRVVMVKLIVELARKARQSGILSLESEASKIDDRFMKRAIQLIVDGTPPEMVREVLETEVDAMGTRHKIGEEVFSTAGGYAPTLGVIGTVMGLVHMLENLDEPGGMGPSIAMAFIATLYGVVSANLIFLPIAAKLRARSAEERSIYDVAIEGILALQAGDNPRVVAMRMRAHLPPALAKQLDEES
jgi:chemotaxis protein MotA